MTNFIKIKDKEGIRYYRENDIEQAYDKLSPDYYALTDTGSIMVGHIPTFTPLRKLDSLIKFNSGVVGEILKRTDRFFSSPVTEKYSEMGIAQKMGIIMYGPPGTGKTCTATLVINELVEKYKAIAIDMTNCQLPFLLFAVNKIRTIQDNPLVIFCDEIEGRMSGYEQSWLTYLDGQDSVPNSIFLGCTNYLGRIPKRITNRRSRIKHLFEINALPLEVYEDYINSKIPSWSKEKTLEFAWAAEEAKLTFDELKHALMDCYIDKIPFSRAIKEVKEYSKQAIWDDGGDNDD